MKRALQVFAVVLAIAAGAQVVSGFIENNTAYARPGESPGA